MQTILNIFKSDNYICLINFLLFILIIGFIYLFIINIKLKNKYEKFIKKLSDGRNIEEDLENYIYRVDRVEKQNRELLEICKELHNELSTCIKKIGIVRYNAFKDTGSDLSFALALLDNKNNGVVLNGIYSREVSNIYAKPIENGVSKYTLSEEENEAIKKAINFNNSYNVKNIN